MKSWTHSIIQWGEQVDPCTLDVNSVQATGMYFKTEPRCEAVWAGMLYGDQLLVVGVYRLQIGDCIVSIYVCWNN